jgi:hypothetical protein
LRDIREPSAQNLDNVVGGGGDGDSGRTGSERDLAASDALVRHDWPAF